MAKSYLKTAAKKNPVTNHLDYRAYLKHVYEDVQTHLENYSYLKFAQDLGFSLTNVIRLVIAGKRNLSPRACAKVTDALGLHGLPRKYFLLLVGFNDSKKRDTRETDLQKLIELKQRILSNDGDKDKLDYFSSWQHPVIREMTKLSGFQSNPQWIASNLYPKIVPTEVEESLKLLESLKLIALDETRERHVPAGGHYVLLPGDEAAGDMAVVRYHQQMIDIAKDAVTLVPQGHREINALTICLSEEAAAKVTEKLRSLCQEILELEEHSSNPSRVYQLNLQFFSLSKTSAKGGKR